MARDFYSQLGTSEYSIRNLICFKEPSQWHHVCFYKTVVYGRHFAHRSGKLRPGSFLRRSCGPLAPQPSPGSMIGKSYGNHGNQYIIGIRIIGYHIILIYNIMGNNIILIDYGNNIYIWWEYHWKQLECRNRHQPESGFWSCKNYNGRDCPFYKALVQLEIMGLAYIFG